ncbi:hypothetical protein [Brevibacillus brevis]|uniref:Uncharacterized protein n=1 Tax=Brevibacillus brevis TaxID=1393 RepID=A0ABY9T3D6_BREBE|nr:hypothetical protein [Brevibacillus brevis]WNC14625.1 hypothetical protein RGB73_28850 [Brevibacillus brevis]
MKQVGKWVGTGLGLVLLLTACNNQAAPNKQNPSRTQSSQQGAQSAQHGAQSAQQGTQTGQHGTQTGQQATHTAQTQNQAATGTETVIPSVDREKKLTTNAQGTTHSGMGTNVYSTIGSSHLHGGGPSTKLEAQLNAAGIHGVQALIVQDAVVLCPSTAGSQSINQMDPMQSHLISHLSGSSYRGSENTSYRQPGTTGTSDQNTHFQQARAHIHRLYGTDTRVLTVSSKAGITAFEQVKKQLRANKHDAKTAEAINKVLREAKR